MRLRFVIILAAGLCTFLNQDLEAEMRGKGPFVAKVCKADDGNLYVLEGFRVSPLQQADQNRVVRLLGKFIQFECNPDQVGYPYAGLQKIKEVNYKDKIQDFQIKVNVQKSIAKYGEPTYFTIDVYTEQEGVYGLDTTNMIGAIWTGDKSVPRVVRLFNVNQVWGEGFNRSGNITVESHKRSSCERSINVVLEPGRYRLVIQDRRQRYDVEGHWTNIDVLIADPIPFTVVADSNDEAVKGRLYSWLNSGPVEERPRVARTLVSLGEGEKVYAKILDDLDTGVFESGGQAGAILFVSEEPSAETVRVLRSLILRQKTDCEIESVLSAMPTDNRPDKRPKVLTDMLLNLLHEKRFVEARNDPGSMSHVRVCDCVAAWLEATTSGSSYFAGKSIEERDKLISVMIEQIEQSSGKQKKR
jgi:hypothetical protein